jgi:hypothetical protein
MSDHSEQPSQAIISAKGHCAVNALTKFRHKHPHWLEKFEIAGPVYALPPETAGALRKPSAGKPPLLTESQVETELAFFKLCQVSNALAVWNGQFIGNAYLVRPPIPPKSYLEGLNWSPAQIAVANKSFEKTDSIAERLKGYIGWLITDPDFIQKRDTLKSQWQALSEDSRPYPLARSLSVPQAQAEPVAVFQQGLDVFLDRFGLTRMLTWDLPEPQGPMWPALLPADAPAMPKHGLHLVLPAHYPLTGTDDILRQIQQQQTQVAKEQGLAASAAGLHHYEVYGQMFDVDLLERTIYSRYGQQKPPRGFVTVMEYSIAETLGLSIHQVQKMRKGIARCRRGERSAIKWLQVSH